MIPPFRWRWGQGSDSQPIQRFMAAARGPKPTWYPLHIVSLLSFPNKQKNHFPCSPLSTSSVWGWVGVAGCVTVRTTSCTVGCGLLPGGVFLFVFWHNPHGRWATNPHFPSRLLSPPSPRSPTGTSLAISSRRLDSSRGAPVPGGAGDLFSHCESSPRLGWLCTLCLAQV